ncbi:MAG: potassium-transporting ATPase subunit KdpA [Actinomycetota bacterium]|nr:potassium-transporting ATPase subunit KdpA [Actinomycetota bacterium]
MINSTIIPLLIMAALIMAVAPFLGRYIYRVFADDQIKKDTKLNKLERNFLSRIGIDPLAEQSWKAYALSLIAFSTVSILFIYLLQRIQYLEPGNTNHLHAVPPALAINTAVSFVTNTNWQNYAGESTMTAITQTLGLAVQNFVSAAVGLSVAIALTRGITRSRRNTIGNFWVDLMRSTTRILLPLATIFSIVLLSQGVIDNLVISRCITTIAGGKQCIPGGLVASQEAIKELGTNGGGYFNANSMHPFENPNFLTNFLEVYSILLIPFSLPFTFGNFAKKRREGITIFAVMLILWASSSLLLLHFETSSNQLNLAKTANLTAVTSTKVLPEGQDLRISTPSCAIFSASTTATSTGAVNCSLDSLEPAASGVALFNMMLGEVSPGGVGSGLYGILVFAILAVFVSGLMVGRTPEYLGKKIQGAEMKLITIYLLISPAAIMIFSAFAVILKTARTAVGNPGAQGLSEIIYSFVSTGNNNGSALAGLSSNTDFYNITQAINMVIGRFGLIIPVLALAGALVSKQAIPQGPGTFATDKPLFASILIATIVLIVGITYFPVLALGPIVAHLSLGH